MKIKIGYFKYHPDVCESPLPLDPFLVDVEYVPVTSLDDLEQCDILMFTPHDERRNSYLAGQELHSDRLLFNDAKKHNLQVADEELTRTHFPDLIHYFDKCKSLDIPTVHVDIHYPSVTTYNTMYDCVITETKHSEQNDNVLGMPMLGIENMRTLIDTAICNTGTMKSSSDLFSLFRPELVDRPYDVFFRLGKCDDVLRQFVMYEFIKANFNNSSQIITSPEMSERRHEQESKLFGSFFTQMYPKAEKFNFYDLKNFYTKVNLGKTEEHDRKHQWAQFSQEEIETGHRGHPIYHLRSDIDIKMNTGYTPNTNISIVPTFLACAEVSLESITGKYDGVNDRTTDLMCLTEKHLQLFYSLTIPLIIDSRPNIEYVRSMGFEFIIEPCAIELDYKYNSPWVHEIREWFTKLQHEDFREIFNNNIAFGTGVLLHNFNVITDYLINGLHKTLLTYKFFAKINRNDKFTRILDTYSSDRNIKKLIGYGCDVSL